MNERGVGERLWNRLPAAPLPEQAPHLAVLRGGRGGGRGAGRLRFLRLTLDLSPLPRLHQLGRHVSCLEEIKTERQGQEDLTDRETDSTA